MKKSIWIMACCMAALLCACNNELDVDVLKGTPKLVLYCFPSTEHDTTIINISGSRPASVSKISAQDFRLRGNIRISYRVNGTEQQVEYAEEATAFVPQGCFYVVNRNQCGDRITIEAAADGFPEIHAETVIPDMPDVKSLSSKPIRRDGTDYEQYQITIGDNPKTEDFYALTALEYEYFIKDIEGDDGEWITDTVQIYTASFPNFDDEPALNPVSTLDDFFEFDNNFRDNFYIFNDHNFDGSQYTLRLNMRNVNWYSDYNTRAVLANGYQFKIYKLSPAYYRFMKSLNDIDNNELGQYGLAPLSPTQNSVVGGLGVVGGYTAVEVQKGNRYDPMRLSKNEIRCNDEAQSFDIELLNYDSWKIDGVIGASIGYDDDYDYNYIFEHGISSDGMRFDGGWCTMTISPEKPRILHIDIQAVPEKYVEHLRSYTLRLKAGNVTRPFSVTQLKIRE